jgi:hypothetical protein
VTGRSRRAGGRKRNASVECAPGLPRPRRALRRASRAALTGSRARTRRARTAPLAARAASATGAGVGDPPRRNDLEPDRPAAERRGFDPQAAFHPRLPHVSRDVGRRPSRSLRRGSPSRRGPPDGTARANPPPATVGTRNTGGTPMNTKRRPVGSSGRKAMPARVMEG